MELSAFAHMTRKNVKVIQPGLVYVIEWDAGGDMGDSSAQSETSVGDRDRRRRGRDKRRESMSGDAEPITPAETVYVACVYALNSPDYLLTRTQLPRLGTLLINPEFEGPTRWVPER